MDKINCNLLEIRKRKHLRQTELAKLTGISQKALSELETGKSKGVSFSTLSKLCAVLEVTLDQLLEVNKESDDGKAKIFLVEKPSCSFCNKKEQEVDVLIVGKPNKDKRQVYICSECVIHCSKLLEDNKKK
jgi:putative transcriptional regulator